MNKITWDYVGFCTSSACAVHCLSIPVLVIFGSTGIVGFLENPLVELCILSVTLVVGALSFVPGYRRHHRLYIFILFITGLLFIVGGELFAGSWGSAILSVAGALIIIYAHYVNLKLTKGKNA